MEAEMTNHNGYTQRNTIVPPLPNPSGSKFTWAGIVRDGLYSVSHKVWKQICAKCTSERVEVWVSTGSHVNKQGREVEDGHWRMVCMCMRQM